MPSAWPIAGGHVSVALVVGTLAHAGVARHLYALVRALGAGRHHAHIYVLEEADAAATRLRALDVPVTTLPRRHAYEPGRLVALARAFRRDGIDLVHAILPAGAAYGALAARLAGIPIVIVSSRAGDPREQRRVRILLRRIYRGATAVLANTRAQAATLAAESELPADRVHVVYDGADLGRSAAPGMLDGLRDRVWHRPLVIGGAGESEAGRPLFFATAARIAARHPEAHFVWLEDRDDCGADGAHAVRPVELPTGVPMTIVPAGADPTPVLRQVVMLCLAGAPERPALDLVPATMAAARPIVAMRVPGIEELVVDGTTGRIVPAGDPAACADAALGLLEDRGRLRSAGQAARLHAERALGVDDMARATVAVYEASLLGRPGPVAGGLDPGLASPTEAGRH